MQGSFGVNLQPPGPGKYFSTGTSSAAHLKFNPASNTRGLEVTSSDVPKESTLAKLRSRRVRDFVKQTSGGQLR